MLSLRSTLAPVLVLLMTCGLAVRASAQEGTRLLREPTVENGTIVFAYANDLWVVGSGGGDAERLTSFPGTETQPHLSPDGRHVAFTGQYDGDTDVFVVPVEGGQPRRLTHHPSADHVRGWTPEGRVLFMSRRRGGPQLLPQIWTVSPDSARTGLPERVSVPRAFKATMADDGRRLAYELVDPWDPEWRNYRGGQAQPIRILDLETMALTKVPWQGERHRNPVWFGDTVYFLSERDRAMNVWAYDTTTDSLRQITSHDTYDVKGLAAGDNAIVYEQAGYLHRYTPSTGETQQLEITVRGDLPWTRPDWKSVGDQVRTAGLSPTGERAVFEARGEVFTVPTEHGDVRNLTESSGAADRSPAWSPDGGQVAWFSDASGEYQLFVADQKGLTEPTRYDLPGPTFYYELEWSPNGSHVLFTDANRTLWTLNLESGEATKVDTDPYATPERAIDPTWSPDGDWIAYTVRQDNLHYAVMLYSLATGESTQVATKLVETRHPTWGADGDYLYFLGSTNLGLDTGWLDMSSYGRPTTYGLYAAVLSADGESPLLPRSDEESTDDDKKSDAESSSSDEVTVEIDTDGLGDRIVSLGEPKRIYSQLRAGPAGTLFYVEQPQGDGDPKLKKYSFEERSSSPFLEGVQQFRLSHDRKKLLYQAGGTWGVVPTSGTPSAGDGQLSMNLETRITPPKEWAQIYREAWRFQRDYFYVENLHGADWPAVYERYQPWLKHAQHRQDLNYVLDVMGGEVSVGHSYTGGGDMPETDEVSVGLLGANLEADAGYYRITRIFEGEPWTDAAGPLAAPGLDVAEGDYLIAIDGTATTTDVNPYVPLEGTAGEQVLLTVNDQPTAQGARTVTVVPTASEAELRRIAWINHNRRVVDSLSNGRLGYVYIPDTGGGGYERFTRNYFSQQHKDGIIIDERFNGGGSAADYMVNVMSRQLHGYFSNPVGNKTPFTSPGAGVWGPKVMLINEMSGSGGDYLPYLFRKMDIGPLVGTRTWGGLVGIWGTPPLVDGGGITAPRGGFFTPEGEWAIEGEGVAPDVEVEMTPRLVEEQNQDPQLRRAIQEGMRLLKTEDVELQEQPPAPDRTRRPDDGGQ